MSHRVEWPLIAVYFLPLIYNKQAAHKMLLKLLTGWIATQTRVTSKPKIVCSQEISNEKFALGQTSRTG